MNKPKPEDATVEQLIKDISYWEDIKTAIHIIPRDSEGGVCVFDKELRQCATANTLKEALIMLIEKNPNSYMLEDEFCTCDWSHLKKHTSE